VNSLAQDQDFLLGLIVEITIDSLPNLINHPNFACGLIRQDDPNAKKLSDSLHEANVASMLLVNNANKLDLPVDGLLVDQVGFAMLDLSNDDRPDCEIAVLSPSRHHAMEAAEKGADLLIFNAPLNQVDDEGDVKGSISDAQWWLEMMELPCALDLRGLETLPTLDTAPADFWLVHHSQITSHDLISL